MSRVQEEVSCSLNELESGLNKRSQLYSGLFRGSNTTGVIMKAILGVWTIAQIMAIVILRSPPGDYPIP